VQRKWSTAPERLTGDLRWPSTIGTRRRGVDAEILSRIGGAESDAREAYLTTGSIRGAATAGSVPRILNLIPLSPPLAAGDRRDVSAHESRTDLGERNEDRLSSPSCLSHKQNLSSPYTRSAYMPHANGLGPTIQKYASLRRKRTTR